MVKEVVEDRVMRIAKRCMTKRSDAFDVINALLDAGIGFRYIKERKMDKEDLIKKVAEALQIKDNTATREKDFLVNFVTDEIWWDRIAEVAVNVTTSLIEEEVDAS